MNRSTSENQLDRLRSALRRWLFPAIGTIAVTVVGVACIRAVDRSAQANVEAKLTTILEAAVKGLTIWIDEQKHNAVYIADRGEIEQSVARIVDSAGGQADIVQSDESTITELQQLVSEANEAFGYTGFVVLDDSGRILASSTTQDVGSYAAELWCEYLPLLFKGKPVVVRPHRNFLLADSNDGVSGKQSLMYVAAPVNDEDGKVIAAIGFGIAPERQFTEILTVARAGDSGETYAFDEDGWMLSDSRFDDQLKQLGILVDAPDASPVLNVRLADRGPEVGGRNESQPLTAMVDLTLNSKDQGNFGILTNVKGFYDYRGVNSVGSYRWLPEYDLGVASKIDYEEAYSPRILIRNIVLVLLGFAAAGACTALVYTRVLGKARQQINQAEQKLRQLGQYTLEQLTGSGGMGDVYRASHAMLRRPTAVKLLRPERSSETSIARFEREVQLTAQLTHPNTISIFDYGRTEGGIFYYAMEYLDGPNLQQVVERDGTVPAGRAIAILKQVCGSLDEAHQAGLVHRDIKPANIILCRRGGMADFVKVLDFGLVTEMDDRDNSFNSMFAGTPVYMSPEIIESPETADARSDIYALGAVGYFLLTGVEVFTGDSLIEICRQHLNDLPIPPSERSGATVNSDLSDIIMRCLAKDPDDRPQSVEELGYLLDRCQSAGNWTQVKARLWWEDFDICPDCDERVALELQKTVCIDVSSCVT